MEATLEHHATTAAWRYAREARGWVGYGMNEAANALEQEVARRPALPGPELLPQVLAQKYCDCMTAAFGSSFLRLVPSPGAGLDLLGEPLSERARDALRDRMGAIAADPLPRVENIGHSSLHYGNLITYLRMMGLVPPSS